MRQRLHPGAEMMNVRDDEFQVIAEVVEVLTTP